MIQKLTSRQIYELTRTCPNSENKADWDNTIWVRADKVSKRINRIVTYKMKEELIDELKTSLNNGVQTEE